MLEAGAAELENRDFSLFDFLWFLLRRNKMFFCNKIPVQDKGTWNRKKQTAKNPYNQLYRVEITHINFLFK